MKEQIRNLFITRTEQLRAIYENSSNIFYSNMPENVKENVVNTFNLTMDDEILFFRDISLRLSGDQGLLMTTSNVYWKLDGNEESNTFYYLDWSQIMSAEYKDMKMYLFGYNGAPFDPPLDISLFFCGRISN